MASKLCRTWQNNDKSSILPYYIVIYVTNINLFLLHQTGHDLDAKIL